MITNGNIVNKTPVPPLVKVREVAKLLSVSRHTVHHLIESGDLEGKPINPSRGKRGRRAGGGKPRVHVRVTRDSLLKFYEDRFGHPLYRALANPFES
jgi:hypothetical protein